MIRDGIEIDKERRFSKIAIYSFAASAFLFIPLSVFAPMGETLLFALVSLTALTTLFIRGRLVDIWRAGPTSILASLLFWALISLFWAYDPGGSARLWMSLALITIGSLALFTLARRVSASEAKIIENWMLIGFTFGLALIAMELMTDLAANRLLFHLKYGHSGVSGAVLSRSIALLVLIAWPIAIILWQRERRLLALTALGGALLVTLFAEVWAIRMACLSGISVAILTYIGGKKTISIIAIILVLGVMSAPILPKTVFAPSHFQTMLSEGHRYSALHRLYIWEFAAQRIAERPLTGWGLDAARLISGGEDTLSGGGQLMQLHPHNGTLQIWLELGLPGAIMFAIFLVSILGSLGRTPQSKFSHAGAIGAITTAFIIANLSFGVWQNWWLSSLGMLTAFVLVIRAFDSQTVPN